MTNLPNLCDRCPRPPFDAAEDAWRREHMDMMIAKIGPERTPGVKALEYVWLTNNQTYNLGYPKGYDITDAATRFQIGTHLLSYAYDNNLDGFFLDLPLGHENKRACIDMVSTLMNLMPDKIIMPNFGSWDAWALTTKIPFWGAWAELRKNTWAHFVEVAIPTRLPLSHFQKLMPSVEASLAAGNLLVLGIDDRPEAALSSVGPYKPDLAAAIALALPKRDNLYVMYQQDATGNPPHCKDYCWNETLWELRREG